jgi:hypothetical protein
VIAAKLGATITEVGTTRGSHGFTVTTKLLWRLQLAWSERFLGLQRSDLNSPVLKTQLTVVSEAVCTRARRARSAHMIYSAGNFRS